MLLSRKKIFPHVGGFFNLCEILTSSGFAWKQQWQEILTRNIKKKSKTNEYLGNASQFPWNSQIDDLV